MRLIKLAASLSLLPLLGACVIYSADHGQTVSVASADLSSTSAASLEPLKRFNMDGQKLTVVVNSNGCTQVSHFEVHLKEAKTTELSFVRNEQDLCRAIVPEGVTLSWTYDELGLKSGQAVKVLNPLST